MELTLDLIAKIGGISTVIGGLSAFLANIWAGRIVRKEQEKIDTFLAKNQSDLDELKSKKLRHHEDRLTCYGAAVDLIAQLVADIDELAIGRTTGANFMDLYLRFNRERHQAYGHMALVAPQSVMDAYDELVEYVLHAADGSLNYQHSEIRALAILWINTVRCDLGINPDPVAYRGSR